MDSLLLLTRRLLVEETVELGAAWLVHVLKLASFSDVLETRLVKQISLLSSQDVLVMSSLSSSCSSLASSSSALAVISVTVPSGFTTAIWKQAVVVPWCSCCR